MEGSTDLALVRGDEVSEAIQETARISGSDHARSHIEALVAQIPIAGSNLAVAMRNYWERGSRRRLGQVLTYLYETTRGHEEKLKRTLTEDQAGELLHTALASAAVSADDKKVGMIKRALANSFLDVERGFVEKQLMLNILKDLTIADAHLLQYIYNSDPQVRTVSKSAHGPAMAQYGIGCWSGAAMYEASYEEGPSERTLERHLQEQFASWPAGIIRGVAGRLDRLGLSALVENLGGTVVKVLREASSRSSLVVVDPGFSGLTRSMGPTQTAIERSRTELGEALLRFAIS